MKETVRKRGRMRERARERGRGGGDKYARVGEEQVRYPSFKADTTCCLFEETEKFGGNDIHQFKSQDSFQYR